MTTINLETIIDAPIERCFDLARSIDLHQRSTGKTNEKAIDGRVSGLINKGEFVTWEATHFYVKQNLTTLITEMKRPNYFIDEMVKGTFKSIRHIHNFKHDSGKTIMTDAFQYEVPFGFAGALFSRLILKNYMIRFLIKRNEMIKEIAESDQWKQFVNL
jgi:ligand-binding SRPBCC domain-containing protein